MQSSQLEKEISASRWLFINHFSSIEIFVRRLHATRLMVIFLFQGFQLIYAWAFPLTFREPKCENLLKEKFLIMVGKKFCWIYEYKYNTNLSFPLYCTYVTQNTFAFLMIRCWYSVRNEWIGKTYLELVKLV